MTSRGSGKEVLRRTAPGEVQQYYRDVVMVYDGTECLIWPYSRATNGVPQMSRDGRNNIVPRILCEDVNGPPPTPEHHAAHSCGKGNLGCVTKGHLSWKTPVQNNADKIIHGTIGRGEKINTAKLKEDQVRAIRSLKGKETLGETAARFGVSFQLVSQIQRRESWSWLPDQEVSQ